MVEMMLSAAAAGVIVKNLVTGQAINFLRANQIKKNGNRSGY
jgi:hypothetical protein